MKPIKLFITGSTGLLGRRLMKLLNTDDFHTVYCLTRSAPGVNDPISKSNTIFIRGNLLNPETYRDALRDSDILVHLAAVTGKAQPHEYFDINATGTLRLIETCRGSNIRSILHVSTIAAAFQDIENYYYAQSKLLAEKSVRDSGISYTIIRPTMIFSATSPIYNNFLKLSKGPFAFVFGSGEKRVQPIFLDDLVSIIDYIVKNDIFHNKIYETGGTETVSYNKLQTILHRTYNGNAPNLIHLPLNLMKTFLNKMEKKYLTIMPITSGQLTSFCNDSIAGDNYFSSRVTPEAISVQNMVERIRREQVREREYVSIKNECLNFTLYLTGLKPNSYVIQKYYKGYLARRDQFDKQTNLFERIIQSACARFPSLIKFVDAYTAVFYKTCLTRKRLVLMTAILECTTPYCKAYEHPDQESKSLFYVSFFGKACSFLLRLVISSLFLLPLQLAFTGSAGLKTGKN